MALISLTIAAGMALAGAALVGADVPVLQPSSGWNIDYAESNCALSRSFGTGEEAVSLAIIPQTGGGRVRIALIAKNPDRFTGSGRARIRFDGSGPWATAMYFSAMDAKSGRIGVVRTLRADLAPLGQAKTLTLDLGGRELVFAIPQMAGALRALATCEGDLSKSWGADPALIAVRPVAIAPQNWVTNNDYPDAALRAQLSGESGVRVSVDIAGKPANCWVVENSGSEALDAKACTIIMHNGRFKPAADKDGKPVMGLWATSFQWMLPGSRLF